MSKHVIPIKKINTIKNHIFIVNDLKIYAKKKKKKKTISEVY